MSFMSKTRTLPSEDTVATIVVDVRPHSLGSESCRVCRAFTLQNSKKVQKSITKRSGGKEGEDKPILVSDKLSDERWFFSTVFVKGVYRDLLVLSTNEHDFAFSIYPLCETDVVQPRRVVNNVEKFHVLRKAVRVSKCDRVDEERTVEYRSIVEPAATANSEPSVDHCTVSPSYNTIH